MFFTKMHGLGNDFVVIDDRNNTLQDSGEIAQRICDRHFGAGADGLLIVKESSRSDIGMDIINSDGSTAEMCGNGIRCFCKYVYEKGIVNKQVMNIETLAGIMRAELIVENSKVVSIRVNMGSPALDKKAVPYAGSCDNLGYTIEVNGKSYNAATILLGVPHTVVYVDEIDKKEIVENGSVIEKLSIFPNRTNVNFVKVINRDKIEVRTWERGAGYTLACGTGTCASAVVSYLMGKTKSNVEASLFGGKLNIEYQNGEVYMTGPAELVYEGEGSF